MTRMESVCARPLSGLAGLLVVLSMAAGCGCGSRQSGQDNSSRPVPTLRILAITDLQGTLEPCGCTSEPLGGVDRLAVVLDKQREGVPTLLLAAGDLLFSPHVHGHDSKTQEVWKAETVLGLLDRFGIAAATLGSADWVFGADELERLLAQARFPVFSGAPLDGEAPPGDEAGERELVSPVPFRSHLVKEVAGTRVGVLGVGGLLGAAGGSGDAVLRAARAGLRELQAENTELVVALVMGDRRLARQVARMPGVDFVVQGGLGESTVRPPEGVENATLLHAGAQGQHLLVLDVYRSGTAERFLDVSDWTRERTRTRLEGQATDLRRRIAEWEETEGVLASDLATQRERLAELERRLDALGRAPKPTGNHFFASLVPLARRLPRNPDVSEVMKDYDLRVNQHNRAAFAGRVPPEVSEGGAAYVGSAACQSCHEEAFSWWSAHAHGRAYATLEELHKQFNLSCVGCHVTGYEQPGGSTVTHLRDGALKNVGCESCHGPGSSHVTSPEVPELIAGEVPERVCVSCHNPEHSDRFVYEPFRQSLLVPGHGLPSRSSGSDDRQPE